MSRPRNVRAKKRPVEVQAGPIAAEKRPELDLLLGWKAAEAARDPIGFSAPRATVEAPTGEAPILYGEDRHLLTIAPTGAGKGRSVIIPNLLRFEGSVIVIDPKGETWHVTARRRKEMG